MSEPPATQPMYPYRNELNWSRAERAIARKVFDAALRPELQEVMREAKQMANQIKEPADLWDLERYLTERRKEIDLALGQPFNASESSILLEHGQESPLRTQGMRRLGERRHRWLEFWNLPATLPRR